MNSRQATAPVLPEGWTDLDVRAIDTVRVLAADAVQKVGNGHPGTAMSLAPAAYLLFQKVMRHDPSEVHWPGRDRFVLSCGHSSLTLYIQLYLGGFGLELDDLKALRTWDSRTPGHPEYGHTAGVEITTGPLGQGLANAVGMAMAARRERGLLDPDAAPGTSPFDHQIYVLASDGDIEEGVTSEASSLAGTQRLGNLTRDLRPQPHLDRGRHQHRPQRGHRGPLPGVRLARAGGRLDQRRTPSTSRTCRSSADALQAAREVTDRPSFISLRTIIGWPAPTKQNTGKAHGSALGDDEVAATKKVLGFDPEQTFEVSDEVIAHTRGLLDRGAEQPGRVAAGLRPWAAANPEGKALYDRMVNDELTPGWEDALPELGRRPQGRRHPRRLGQGARAPSPRCCPSCGAARPTWPSPTTPPWRASRASCRPTGSPRRSRATRTAGRCTSASASTPWASIMNGIKVHGGTRPYGGTFLQFSDYMRGAVRLSALMRLPGHLRLDPRLDRPRRGRPDPPADRAPGRPAGHPGPGRGPAGRRQRDGRGLGRDPARTPTARPG